jgi:hypothetical protein
VKNAITLKPKDLELAAMYRKGPSGLTELEWEAICDQFDSLITEVSEKCDRTYEQDCERRADRLVCDGREDDLVDGIPAEVYLRLYAERGEE